MLRVAAWTACLFGAGATVSRMFSSRWSDPIVLLALGIAFLFVARRTGRARPVLSRLRARAAAPDAAPAAAPAAVPVEQSA